MTYDFDGLIDRRGTDSVKWRLFGDDVLPMWVADMDFRSPEPVIRALCERVEHGIFGYGVEPPELREVLVQRLARLYGWAVPPEAIVFLPGVVVGLRAACRAVAAPGDGVLVQTPVYPPIWHAWRDTGLSRHEMALTRGSDGRYTIDFEALERAIDERTRIFVLCNPHNPVGRVFSAQELERMAEICLRHDVVICSDEIHGDLILSGYRHRPIASLAPEIAARAITLMAPSKTFNIAGLHCAFAVITDAGLRECFCAGQAGLVEHPSILDYAAALAAYRDGQPWLDELLPYLEANRDYLLEYVRTRLPGVSVGRPEGTYLAWLDCREAGIAGNVHEFFLQRARVAVNDGATFGPGGEGFVRLNFGCPRATLTEGLERMRAALL
ncbi:MAG TPA: PatB family C-S lyase [Anaerolineae bacterium]|nr:PatB family C-S lyase [Anaerolineae bacterium]HOR01511.1 PatB family C-S lyase [Anaerolineae bacterium]HPL28551.1 PatB family C-S lyase [Anaerolineae bacterium]